MLTHSHCAWLATGQVILTAAIVPRNAGQNYRIGERIVCDVSISGVTAATAEAGSELVYSVDADGDMWLATGTSTRRFRLPVRALPGWGGP